MTFEGLTERLSTAFKNLKSKGKLTEADVKPAMREVRLTLLGADVNYKVAKDFTNKVTERTIGMQMMENLAPAQMVIKIVDEELTELMGRRQARLNEASKPPTIVMLCDLQDTGKATHAGKLAAMLKKQGRRPILVARDIYHPAAIKQLQVVGPQAGVPMFEQGSTKPVDACRAAVRHARDYGNDILVLGTVGRLQIDEALVNEFKELKDALEPQEISLVVDSMTGQEAMNVAKTLDDLLNISGVILTELDGDIRSGATPSARTVTGKLIKYASIGEKLTDLGVFHPDCMASRVLRMGDVLTLIEDVQQSIDKKTAEQTARKMMQNKMDLNDLFDQFSQMKKMGPLKSVLSKLPSIDKQIKDIGIDEHIMDRSATIILSMTSEERENPSVINSSRKRRIAVGCDMRVEGVNRLLKQFEQIQKMMKQVRGLRKKKGLPGIPGTPGTPGQGGMPF